MVKLLIVGCVLAMSFGVFSMFSFLATTAFVVGGYAFPWKFIALGAVLFLVWKRVK